MSGDGVSERRGRCRDRVLLGLPEGVGQVPHSLSWSAVDSLFQGLGATDPRLDL